MSKKIMMLALAAVTAAMIAVPATASATLVPLHMNPTPAKLDIAGGAATLRSNLGTVTCNGVTGTATPESGGTTGTMQLTFGPDCTGPGGHCTSNSPAQPTANIQTTVLTYHLVTLDAHGTAVTDSNALAGVLVTPNHTTNTFAHFNCIILGFPVQVTVEGNGVLGTITTPQCGTSSSHSTIDFNAVNATTTQTHTYTHNDNSNLTTGKWTLTRGGANASQEAEATLTATDANGNVVNSELVCT